MYYLYPLWLLLYVLCLPLPMAVLCIDFKDTGGEVQTRTGFHQAIFVESVVNY